MINDVRLQRFKCFSDKSISMKPLTILAGSNNTGKSSVIQSLLLIRQGVKSRNRNKNKELPLNGPLVHMGTANDVLCQWEKDEDNIEIDIDFSDIKIPLHWKLELISKKSDDLSMKLTNSPKKILNNEGLFNNNFSYISADRIGPKLYHTFSEEDIGQMNVGIRGEFTIQCLQKFGLDKITLKELKYKQQDESETLSFQTEKWINYLISGIRFKYTRITHLDMLDISIRTIKPGKDTEYMRPTNVGFGISYSLPIIVSGLMSKKNSLLIVENPEAHLHPRAQSRIGHFFSRLAAAGVQVIVETHSDHILNGIRVSVKNEIIKPRDISINYFDENYNLHKPEIDSDGRIDSWPDGFFDQMEKDLQELI